MAESVAKGRLLWPDLAECARLANQAHDLLMPLLPQEEQVGAGGFFALTDLRGIPYFVFQVGSPPFEKLRGRLERAANEKPTRTASSGRETSRETRDPAREQWGGALRSKMNNCIGSFSGYPEDFDEILVAHVMVGIGSLTPMQALLLLAANESFDEVDHLFSWSKEI